MRVILKAKVITFFMILLGAGDAFAIQKCQDSQGKWHYGDNAEDICENSEVTTLTERGFVKDKLEAPKTEEEIAVEAALLEKKREEEQRKRIELEERDRVLSIYEEEADIERQRDNKLASVDGNIRVHKAYLKQMDAKLLRLQEKAGVAKGKRKETIEMEILESQSRVKEFSTELKRLEEQKVGISKKFAREKELYKKFKLEGR